MKRGIITSSGRMTRQDSDSVSINSSISEEDLNYYLLYWDKILMPTNNMIHVSVKNEDQLLKTGFFERPKVNFTNWSTHMNKGSYDPFLMAQSIVANEVIPNDKSFDWTIHQIGDHIAISKDQSKEFNSIKVELLNCLPVPSGETNFQDILEFKEKRTDELLALHSTIDELYLEILNSPDKDLQLRKSISDFKMAIANIDTVSKERFKMLTKYNFTTELNINGQNIALALGGGATFDFFSNGMTLPIVTILAGLTSFIKVKANRTTSVKKAGEKLKLNFLADANKRHIVKVNSKKH
ncbi:DUF6236 family protein [Labilibaculum sp.]|uniref:DUF6236 family protein n=1 Tax=Labilibaculum sp. TaxID=2060723 RepID=UPI002AA7C60B|nr:DUF6236 family protein [Labilibaculum sp.]